MFLYLARGLMIECIGIALHFLRKCIRIHRSLYDAEMLHEFQGDVVHAEIERSLPSIANRKQHAKKGLMPAVNFFQFLRIHRCRHAHIARPQSIPVLAILAAHERAAGSLLVPAHRGNFILIVAGRRQLGDGFVSANAQQQ